MKRLNVGCGSVQPAGWDNADRVNHGQQVVWDVLETPTIMLRSYDVIVANHVLSDIGHHDLDLALANIRLILKPGGVLRVLVPDIRQAFEAYEYGDEGWFPQDSRTGGLDAKFCTFLTWFGESKSVFTHRYLVELLREAGYSDWSGPLGCGITQFGTRETCELDDRCTEALIMEAVR